MIASSSITHDIGVIFHPLLVGVAALLAFIYGIFPTYAVAIALLTLLIMGLLTPLTIKSTRSMIAMQALQPEMQKLRAKYKGPENREQLNQELMRLYKEEGVNPAGGCLPMLLQMPALFAFYSIVRGLSTTVSKGGIISGTGKTAVKCVQTLCATPHYIPTNSEMYHNLALTPGVMKAWGFNLASKLLTHHSNVLGYFPYIVLAVLAVALQYIQMSQMTKRYRRTNQVNPQMQQMQNIQKFMPLIMAYIYFVVPAGAVLYMVVSSGVRLATQDLMYRTGLVKLPGGDGAIPAKATDISPSPPSSGTASTPKPTNQRRPSGNSANRRPAGNGKRSEIEASPEEPAPRSHPRSKAKRARKPRGMG